MTALVALHSAQLFAELGQKERQLGFLLRRLTDRELNGECTLNTNDAFCGDAGICLPYLGGQDQRGPYITWQCGQRCTPGAPNPGCRTGYVCDQFNTQAFGTCVPDCRGNTVNVCGSGTCNATTGICQY